MTRADAEYGRKTVVVHVARDESRGFWQTDDDIGDQSGFGFEKLLDRRARSTEGKSKMVET